MRIPIDDLARGREQRLSRHRQRNNDRELRLPRFVVSRTDETVNRSFNVLGRMLVTKRQHNECSHDFALRVWYLKLGQSLDKITPASGQGKLEAGDTRELRPYRHQRILESHSFQCFCKPKVLGEERADIVLNCRDKCLLLERVLL